jgi:iron complex outermembrane receptor protein
MGPACPFPIPNAFPYNATGPVNQSANFHAPSWTVDADYQVTDESMVYATYRRGYKSGGFNSGAGAAAAGFGEFKPEFLTDVELGSKNNWTIIGVPGRTNVDVYYGWYDDVQKNDLVDVEAPGFFEPVALTFNAAKANVKGLEFQTTIVPEENFEVNFFYSYTDATYRNFALPQAIVNGVPVGVNDLSGSPFAYTPKNKLGLSPRFHIPVDTNLGMPYIGGSLYWQSSEWFSDLATVQNTCSAFVMPSPPPGLPYTCLAPGGQRPEQKAYALVNFRFDWNNFLGNPVDASVFVNNAFNKTYQVGANALLNLTGTNASIYAPPRMWGVELRYRIGADAHSDE